MVGPSLSFMNIAFLTNTSSPWLKICFTALFILVLQVVVLPWILRTRFLRTKKRIEGAILWCEFLGTAIIGAAAVPNPYIKLGGFSPLIQIFDPYIGVQLVYVAFYLKWRLHNKKR